MTVLLLNFAMRRAAELCAQAQMEIYGARRRGDTREDELRERWALRIEKLAGKHGLAAFYRECQARDMIWQGESALNHWAGTQENEALRRAALSLVDEGRAQLASTWDR